MLRWMQHYRAEYDFFDGFYVSSRAQIAKFHLSFVQEAVVVAQLVEQSPPTPETCGSNPNISKVLSTNCN